MIGDFMCLCVRNALIGTIMCKTIGGPGFPGITIYYYDTCP